MSLGTKRHTEYAFFQLFMFMGLFALIVVPPLPSSACADLSLLKKIIIEYNLEHHEKSLLDGSYRGEEGVLRIGPEVGLSLGLHVLIDRDYLDAMERYKEAKELLERAVEAMTTQEKERFIGENVNMIAESALLYNKSLQAAQDHIMAYHSKVRRGIDDRLNEAICSGLLEELLEESLKKTSCNLRDALAHFYNRCQGLDEDPEPLSGRNVLFVNHVFWEFTGKASLTAMKPFDLDKCNTNSGLDFGVGWKHVFGRAGSRYISLLKLE